MKRIVLFSMPTKKNTKMLLSLIFPKDLPNKVLAFMPSNGANCPLKHKILIQGYCKAKRAKFLYIDNSKEGENAKDEVKKVEDANILLISGGNTFTLLRNLRSSKLDKAVIDFTKKDEFVLSGFSAGAIVLTPTIEICNIEGYDDNEVGLNDFTSLNIVDFEIFPHYSDKWSEKVACYEKSSKYEVKKLSDDDHLVIDI